MSATATAAAGAKRSAPRPVEELDSVTIRFVGDSGDGMQLTGNEFSKAIAKAGHDFATHPDYPSEIRAPTGTLFGVSGYQIQFASRAVFTSGDAPDVLVAMNPAALQVNLRDLRTNGILIVNVDEFDERNLKKAGYAANPLEGAPGQRRQRHGQDAIRREAAVLEGIGRVACLLQV
ncbi:MAG: 2-oxoacid:acceptor oxidoreductase family protein, partial [Rhodocyclaceae bacterium]|nr:2-oxoacid:acceptor oxidoreductase family protein [Rhodocyclaceae bacterium]